MLAVCLLTWYCSGIMFPVPALDTFYTSFFKILALELEVAESKHSHPGLAGKSYWRLKRWEVIQELGRTDFVGQNDPSELVSQYVRYLYGETNTKPDFLISLEGR